MSGGPGSVSRTMEEQFLFRQAVFFSYFINDEWVAYNWYWYMADPEHPELPEGYAERFRERLI
jgi:hypothetical protein